MDDERIWVHFQRGVGWLVMKGNNGELGPFDDRATAEAAAAALRKRR